MSPSRRPAGPAAMVAALGPLPSRIARAMERVPRHLFVPPGVRHRAYDDEPIPLEGADSTISAPHMVAIQLEAANLAPGQKILEVGSGSGYLLALVAELTDPGGTAVGIEVDPMLAEESRRTLGSLGYGARVVVRAGDGREGARDLAPFDRIIVSCAVPQIEPEWRSELDAHGLIVAPVGGAWSQTLTIVGREPSGRATLGPSCRFVAIRPGPASAPAHI